MFAAQHIRRHYDKELPKSCMALLRTTMSADEWLGEIIPLAYDIKTLLGNQMIELPGLRIPYFLEITPPKSRILLYGEAGTGKSTTLSELCTSWKKRIQLSMRFSHAYLIPIRNIVNPYASLEHIICQDLEIVPAHEEQAVRRFIKFNSKSVIWFLDGYDERTSHGKKETTINKLISGKTATNSTVVVTSRSPDADLLSSIMTNKVAEIYMKGFDESGVRRYLNKLPTDWAPSYRNLVLNSNIPKELLKSPLIVAMVCYIHQKVKNGDKEGGINTIKLVNTSSVLDAVCGIFLGIKEEKAEGCELFKYAGYRDERLSKKVKGVIGTITKLAFHYLSAGKYDIHIDKFNENNVYEDDLKNIGILNLANSKYSFIHLLLQEHAAAHHMADSEDDLKHILALLKKPGLMVTKLGVLSSPLLFVVGLKPSVLNLIGDAAKELSVVRIIQSDSVTNCNNLDLELSYQARLFHECHDPNTRARYVDKLKQYSLPAEPVTLSHPPQIQASAYITLVDALGLDGCLHLLKEVHKDAMIITGRRVTLSAPNGSSTRYITDTILISCLPVVDMIQTERLVIQYSSLHVLAHTAKKFKVMYSLNIYDI